MGSWWGLGGECVCETLQQILTAHGSAAPLLRSSFLCSSRYSAAHGIDLLQPPQGFPQLRACLQGALLHARLSAKINCHHPSHRRIHNCRTSHVLYIYNYFECSWEVRGGGGESFPNKIQLCARAEHPNSKSSSKRQFLYYFHIRIRKASLSSQI